MPLAPAWNILCPRSQLSALRPYVSVPHQCCYRPEDLPRAVPELAGGIFHHRDAVLLFPFEKADLSASRVVSDLNSSEAARACARASRLGV
jgi:hypothetical protein